MPHTLKYYKRNLPHWLVADHSYFVTLRLKGTLPKAVVEHIRAEDDGSSEETATAQARERFCTMERILDALTDARWLTDPRVAPLIWDNLDWMRGRGWKIYAAVLMPNHMHWLLRNEQGRTEQLLNDLGQFKSFTAKRANKVLSRGGAFWAREDFDHWIRNRGKFEATIRYIANNPVKAGLARHWSAWPWFTVDESVRSFLPDAEASS